MYILMWMRVMFRLLCWSARFQPCFLEQWPENYYWFYVQLFPPEIDSICQRFMCHAVIFSGHAHKFKGAHELRDHNPGDYSQS